MLILLVGPSGVGKTTEGRAVCERIPDCEFHDIDDLIGKSQNRQASQLLPEVGADRFAEISLDVVEAVSKDCADKIGLAAVGAGTLESRSTIEWLRNYVTVAITAPAEEVYRRDRLRFQRTLKKFTKVEYSDYRMSIYNSATYQHPVSGLSLEQASEELFRLLTEIILSERTRGNV